MIAYSIACRHYASYKSMFPEVFIKITSLPILDHIRDLRYTHLGKLIKGNYLIIQFMESWLFVVKYLISSKRLYIGVQNVASSKDLSILIISTM